MFFQIFDPSFLYKFLSHLSSAQDHIKIKKNGDRPFLDEEVGRAEIKKKIIFYRQNGMKNE